MRNGIISQMGQEIRKGPDWMQTFNWCLRYTQSPKDAFVTGPQPLMVTGPASDLVTALKHPETLIFFPICWQACLIGSLRRFDVGTDPAQPSLLSDIRRLYQQPENGYLISSDVFTPYPAAALGEYRLVPQ